MRAYLPAYDLRMPANLSEALDLLAREPGVWQPFAGGTDLMVLLEAGKLAHKRFLSLSNLEELRGIEVRHDDVLLGALTTYSDVLRNSVLRLEFPLLCSAARETGSIATQNRGTLGQHRQRIPCRGFSSCAAGLRCRNRAYIRAWIAVDASPRLSHRIQKNAARTRRIAPPHAACHGGRRLGASTTGRSVRGRRRQSPRCVSRESRCWNAAPSAMFASPLGALLPSSSAR